MSILSAPHFHDEQAAYDFVEAKVWANGRVCPHCGVVDNSALLKGKSTRIGTYKCYSCRKPFTVKVGTIFESSHIALKLWLQAIFLMSSSKKGISANQLHRTLGITLKSAWFMAHRIREAMTDGYVRKAGPIGGEGAVVEADEAYLGPDPQKDTRVKVPSRGIHAHLLRVYALVERGGHVRSFHVKDVDTHTLMGIMQDQVDAKSRIITDEAAAYRKAKRVFVAHQTVSHRSGEYVRGDVHTNTVEGFFSVFKRGMRGTYQHCNSKHLRRYLAEFDFRYNNRVALGVNDVARADALLAGVVGKRLTYQRAH